MSHTLKLGIYIKRDWGYAKDYVYGMWQMLQEEC
jgi:GDP-D-mannose dehydratase